MSELKNKKSNLIFYGCCFFTFSASSQHFSIYIKDNLNSQFISASYNITTDSLVINGVADMGKSQVNYLSRILTPTERARLGAFLITFPADSLMGTYFGDYTNFEYIAADNFPRMLEVEIEKGKHNYKSKSTNAYVAGYATIFNYINSMIPAEVKIKYESNKFNAFY